MFADLLAELGEDRGQCRAPFFDYLPERGGHLLAPLTAGRREARGQDGDVDTA